MLNIKCLMQSLLLLVVGSVVSIPQAYAYTCSTVTTSTTLTLPNLTVRRDAAVGSVIGSAISTGSITAYSCTNEAPALAGQKIGFKGYGTKSSQIDGGNVYLLGPASTGIGYTISGADDVCTTVRLMNTADDIYYTCGITTSFPARPLTYSLTFTFYKIGDVTSSSVPAQKMASVILQNNYGPLMTPESAVSSSAFKITSLGCTLSSAAINVPMGTVNSANFPSSSYGATMPAKNFSIPLTCDVGTAVTLRIDPGAAGTVDYKNGVLQLDSASSGTAATGVALQILRNGNPQATGSVINIGKPSATGAFNIPLSARYFRSAATVTAGQANASATFTLTYN